MMAGSYICTDVHSPSFFQMYIFWLPVIVGHGVLCLVALWHGIRNWMSGYRIRGMNRVHLADVLIKGNVGYYLCLSNIVIGLYLGDTWTVVSEAFPAPIHVVIGCRLILNLRSTLSRDVQGDCPSRLADIETPRFALPDESVPG